MTMAPCCAQKSKTGPQYCFISRVLRPLPDKLPPSTTQSHKLAACWQFGFHSLFVSRLCADVCRALFGGVYQSEVINSWSRSEGKPQKGKGRMGKWCRLWTWFQNVKFIWRMRLKTGGAESTQNLIYKDFGRGSVLLGSWGGCFSSETQGPKEGISNDLCRDLSLWFEAKEWTACFTTVDDTLHTIIHNTLAHPHPWWAAQHL